MSGATSDYTIAPDGSFTAPLELFYPYKRTVGPTLSRFLTGLRDQCIEGTRGKDGRVHVPPAEFDPVTGDPLTEWAEVGPQGTVVSWSWQPAPVEGNALQHPFAWALIRLDGADTALLHSVDAGRADAMSTGMRVQARWAEERTGSISDISCFEPATGDGSPRGTRIASDDVLRIRTPIGVHYQYSAGPNASSHLRGLMEGKFVGKRCPSCTLVYMPPRSTCAKCGVMLGEDVEVGPKGTITTFCVVNVPFLGQTIKIPYVAATILIDGADLGMQHLIQECEASEVRMGMRVEPVWKPREEWQPSLANVTHFRPTGEPDADFAAFAGQL